MFEEESLDRFRQRAHALASRMRFDPFLSNIESLCPSSRSLYSHPAGLAAFLWEPAADPTELNPCPACRAGSHSCKERARRTGTIRMVPERDAAVRAP